MASGSTAMSGRNFNEQLEMAQAYLSDRRKLLETSLKTRSASWQEGGDSSTWRTQDRQGLSLAISVAFSRVQMAGSSR